MENQNKIFALVDINNCYVSCERVLQAFTMLSLNSLLYVLRFLATGGVAEYRFMLMD